MSREAAGRQAPASSLRLAVDQADNRIGPPHQPDLRATHLLRADAEEREDGLLHLRTVDPHAARAEFPAVQDQVVGLRANRQQVARLEQLQVLLVGHRERVVGRDGIAGLVKPFEQWKVAHPQEVQPTLGDRGTTEFET